MWKLLSYWRKAIDILKPAVEEQPLPSPPPPTTFLHPAPRQTVAQKLPYKLAVDPLESSLFYRSLEGKIVSRSLASGEIQWQSEEYGYPLRVTDQILWVVQSDAIAAYSTIDGQLLLRSRQLRLPGEITHSVCDLSQQTLQIELLYVHPYTGGTYQPPLKDKAAYQISLIAGEVTRLYSSHQYDFWDERIARNWEEANAEFYPSVSHEQLLTIIRSEENFESAQQSRQDDRIFNEYCAGFFASAQLHTASVIIHTEYIINETRDSWKVLSVFSNQPPYSKQWETIIDEYRREPEGPLVC